MTARAVGVLLTLSIHAVMFDITHLGEAKARVLEPDASGVGATAGTELGKPLATLFLINLPQTTSSQGEPQPALSMVEPDKNTLITVLSSDPAPALETGDVRENENLDGVLSPQEENPAVRAQMFARYTGQINARIERAWRRPRTSVRDSREIRPPGVEPDSLTPDRFRCHVQIVQDKLGQVKEVQLADCNGTVAWQMSLVHAIQQASPLPAPPTPSVFSNSLQLSFESEAFGGSMRDDAFETEAELDARLTRVTRR